MVEPVLLNQWNISRFSPVMTEAKAWHSLLEQSRFQTMCGNTDLHTQRVRDFQIFIENERLKIIFWTWETRAGEATKQSTNTVLLEFLEMSCFFRNREREINKQNNWTSTLTNCVLCYSANSGCLHNKQWEAHLCV